MTDHDEVAITDYATSIFLRYFRSGQRTDAISTPALDLRRDMDLLRSHWAVSEPVQKFLTYMISHPHEVQSLLAFRRREDDAIVRGRIDARATVMRRLTSGLDSAVVSHEPVRSFDTGPNQLVAWVIHHASLYATRLFSQIPDGESGYRNLVQPVVEKLDAVKRQEMLREPLKSISAARRPGLGAVRHAQRSRRPLYREAANAYRMLHEIESNDKNALRTIIQSTLIAPADVWQRFEMAVAMATGLALSEVTGKSLRLNNVLPGATGPIMRCGNHALYWQKTTKFYSAPESEPSEKRVLEALKAYGLKGSWDLPDLVLVDEEEPRVLAVMEVKYVQGDTVTNRFREAMHQVIRYARGYAEGGRNRCISETLLDRHEHWQALLDRRNGDNTRSNGLRRDAQRRTCSMAEIESEGLDPLAPSPRKPLPPHPLRNIRVF